MDVTRRPLAALAHLLLPLACLGCSAPLPGAATPLHLCLACRGKMPLHRPGCPRCGAPLPDGRRAAEACRECRLRAPAFQRFLAPWAFAPPLTFVLHQLKFRRRGDLGARVATALAEWLELSLAPPLDPPPEAVCAVPLHPWRRWRRGYNQAERIGRPLARHLGLPYTAPLRRRRATPPQTALSRQRRRGNVDGAFAATRRAANAVAGRRVLLVDDVATTGATLDAAARALRQAGARAVVALAAARTPFPGDGG